MPTVIETANRFKNELLRHETNSTNQMLGAYKLVTNRLEDKLSGLMSQIEALEAQGTLTPNNIKNLAVWPSLLNQLQDEVTKFGGFVDTHNTLAANKSIDLASNHSQLLTAVNFQDKPDLTKAFNATWDKLSTEAIQTLLGFLQPDSQLHTNLTSTLGSSATENFVNKLLEGIALGYNPRKINALINQTLGEPLTWSLNTVRTTQLYSYREATRANYIANSEIIGGWRWYAALDGRVCLSCVNKHGSIHSIEEGLNDHHSGRCTQIPLVKNAKQFGLTDPEIEIGEDWFNRLPETQQVQRMGEAKYTAYKAGEFRFDDLSEEYQNDTFGLMIKEASLLGILGDRAERYYSR